MNGLNSSKQTGGGALRIVRAARKKALKLLNETVGTNLTIDGLANIYIQIHVLSLYKDNLRET